MTKSQPAPNSSGIRNIAILFAVVAVLYVARELLIPLAFAITLSMILAPIVAKLEKLRLGRVPSALLVVLVATACVAGAGWVIFNDVVQVAIELPEYRDNINKKIEALNAPGASALGRAAESVQELGKQISNPPALPPPGSNGQVAGPRLPHTAPLARPLAVQIVNEPGNEFQYMGDVIKPFLRPLGIFVMVLIFSLCLLSRHDDLRGRLFRLVVVNQLNVTTQALK